MDMELSDLFLSLALIIPILVTAINLFRSKSAGVKNLPPGSFGWPIIGETLEFLFENPEKFVLDRMKKYSPDIFKTKILGEKTVVICGPNGHKFLFSNEQKLFTVFRPHSMQKMFRSYEGKTPAIITRDEVLHALRAPGFLKPEALVRYLAKMDSITQQHMQAHWEGKNEVKACYLTKTLTISLACRFFLGKEDPGFISRRVGCFDDVTVGMISIPLDFPGTIFYRAKRAADEIMKELRAVINEKKDALARGEPRQDILSHMIVAPDKCGKPMPESEIAAKLMGLLVAGYNTVSTALTFFLKYVGERPDIYKNILAEQQEIAAAKKPGELLDWDDFAKMKYSWNVMCEVIRLTPPIQGTFREVLIDFNYAGYTIPKGWKVYWTVSTSNKNPVYFPDPKEINPSRYDEGNSFPPFTFVPFGGGPRTCPGKEYSRLAILTFVHNVVKRFEWEPVFPKEKILDNMTTISPEKGLPIRLRHR